MDWSDESYVKLYTRDTVTWRSWPWQARCVFPLLMKKLDGAGLMPTGRLDAARAVAVMIEVPIEVVTPALEAMLADGTVEQVASGLLVPKFLEAQEARKNDRLRSAEYRSRSRDIAKGARLLEGPVTPHHTESLDVTERHPPAPPRPAPPLKTTAPRKPGAVVDPRLAHLSRLLVEDYEHVRGEPYKHGGAKDTQALKLLLPLADDPSIRRRWVKGLEASGKDWASCSTFAELGRKWTHLAAPEHQGFDPNQGIIRSSEAP